MFYKSRPSRVGIGFLAMLLTVGTSEASFWGRLTSKIASPRESVASSQPLQIVEGSAQLELHPSWSIDLKEGLTEKAWLGTTYKNVPYTEKEFHALRTKKIEDEVNALRKEYISKKKAELNKDAGAAVDNLLDDLLGGDDAAGQEEEDLDAYLEGFDEAAVRRRVASRTFVSQNRAMVIPCVYVETKKGDLFCLELETGLTVWVVSLDAPLSVIPFETEKYLYVVSGVTCKIIDKRSGYLTEEHRFDRVINPKVFGVGRRVFAYTYDERLMCYEWGGRFSKWSQKLQGSVSRGIYGYGDSVLVPLMNGKFYSVSIDGQIQWSFVSKSQSDEKIYLEKVREQHLKELEREQAMARKEGRPEEKPFVRKHMKAIDDINAKIRSLELRARGKYSAGPAVDGEDLFVGSTDFQFYKLSRYSGLPEWSYTCETEILDAPQWTERWVWQLTAGGRLHRIDRKTGRGEVVQSGVMELLGVHGEAAVVRGVDGVVRFWSPEYAAEVQGRRVSDDQFVVVSPEHGLLVWRDARGLVETYSVESLRALR